MTMRLLPSFASRLVINRALERDEHDKNRIAPLVELHLIHDVCSHHFRSEQISYEVTRVDVRDDQLTSGNLLAASETHGSSALCVAENFLHKRVGADFAATCSQIFSQCERNAMHSAFDQVVPGVLQD